MDRILNSVVLPASAGVAQCYPAKSGLAYFQIRQREQSITGRYHSLYGWRDIRGQGGAPFFYAHGNASTQNLSLYLNSKLTIRISSIVGL